MHHYRWGTLGTGAIAKLFAKQLAASQGGHLHAVASVTAGRASAFAADFPNVTAHESYDALLNDPDIDIVHIALPHHLHKKWTLEAAKHKKHVLCEKPIALIRSDALTMIQTCRENDVFFMEGFMYRCHPQTETLLQLIREKAVGDIIHIDAEFGYAFPFQPEHRVWSKVMGGGGILDVGCYPASMARLIAGAAIGKPFEEPTSLTATGILNAETGVDEHAVCQLKFENGITAEIVTSVTTALDNDLRLEGTEGSIHISNPWTPGKNGNPSTITIHHHPKNTTATIEFPATHHLYMFEANNVMKNIIHRESPAMSWTDSLGNIAVLDEWRRQIGYDL